jgi:predicted phage terminase large subunit-like protein
MQRLHVDDLTGHCLRQNAILAKNRQWHHLCLPAIFDDILHERSHGDNRLNGELLFPARFGAEVLEQEKKVKGGWGFAGQYQQSPFPAEGGIFKKEYFKNIKELDKPVSYFKNIIQCWDMTFKGGAKSDYVAGVVFAYDNGKFWLIDYIKKRLSFNESIDAVLKLTSQYLTTKHNIYIEDKANGSAIIDTLRNKLSGFSVKEINVNGNSKFARANSIEPILASDNLFINSGMGQDKINLFIDDMMQFREGGGNDDLVDATVHAITALSKNFTSGGYNIWAA